MPLVGSRVVRGPCWSMDDQDGGEGNIGTIIEIRGHIVLVAWDSVNSSEG